MELQSFLPHYIEEAENIADRISVINDGRILITEKKK